MRPDPVSGSIDVDELAQAIREPEPGGDPVEARRATEISYSYSRQLKQNWNVTDSAIIHNAKVISGFHECGFCNDWAQAKSAPLRQENFGTLDLHRATSLPTALRIIHHSALINSKGDSKYDGIILDPWRNSGVLHWASVREDTKINWQPRPDVQEELIRGTSPY